jgi:hypothetical protein
MPLTSLRGLTSESFNAGGTVKIDLTNGSVVSEIRGLPSGDSFDLWLIDKPIRDRANHVCRIPRCLAEGWTLQLDIRTAHPVGYGR